MLLIFFAILGVFSLIVYIQTSPIDYQGRDKLKVDVTHLYDFDLNGRKEGISFHSSSVKLNNGITEVFLQNQTKPELILQGYFVGSRFLYIRNGLQILEVEVLVGKSINTLVYKYENGKLIRIPVSTEKTPSFEGIVSRNSPEFKDIDNDGVLEILAYYRYFPPEKKRTVKVYKFNGEQFEKYKEYEEETSAVYL